MTRILVVDDNTDLLRLIELKLNQEGYQVDLAENGFDGLRIAAEKPPDLIILDIMMPEIDGWEFCQRIRETSNVPILMLTAKTEDADVVKGLELGADEYLTKPFRLNTLSARIDALLRRQAWNKSSIQGELDSLKSSIISSLSHELRTPVALILNALDLALREAFRDEPDAQRSFIVEAQENAETLRWLIEDLLLLVRIDEGLEVLVRPTSIHSQLHRMISRNEKTLNEHGIQVRLICPEDITIVVDQVLLRQALYHLFRNSIHQSPDRGQIQVRVERTGGEMIYIDFQDEGPGVAEQSQPHIFDRFYQGTGDQDWKWNGLGIGLYIARSIAMAHGGDVSLLSKPGEGSTFRVALPAGHVGSQDGVN